jgi:(p)ppGpp synthase/HD superfamily hydrolase
MSLSSLSARFEEALVHAFRLHRDQRRKASDVPYVSHLLAVTSLVIEHGGGEEEAIAALLHDAVEDQGGAPVLDEIRKRFGDGVAAIVEACSDTDEHPKPPWRPRKEAHLARLLQASASVKLVSAADKVHNARSILADYREGGEAVWNRFNGGKEGTLWYYRAALEALREGAPPALLKDLERLLDEIERLAGI